MKGDYLGNLAAASLNRAPGVRPRLAARFERPQADAGLVMPRPAESEPAHLKLDRIAGTPDASTARPIDSSAEQAVPPGRPAELARPAVRPPESRQDDLSPTPDESPSTARRSLEPPVAGQPEARPATGIQKPQTTSLPVKLGLEAPQSAAVAPPDREQAAPSRALRPQQERPVAQQGAYDGAAPPAADPPASVPILATLAAPYSEPDSRTQFEAPWPSQPSMEAELRPASLGQWQAGPESRTVEPLASRDRRESPAVAARSAPQIEAQVRPLADEPAQLTTDLVFRPTPGDDLAQPDAALSATPTMREIVRETIRPHWQARREGPSPPPAGSAPTIRVTIGRIEVRANVLPAPQPQAKPARRQPPLPLDAYLKRRNQGHGGH